MQWNVPAENLPVFSYLRISTIRKHTDSLPLMLQIKVFCFNPFGENTYLLWDTPSGDGVIVDPGCYDEEEFSRLLSFIGKEGIKPLGILLTHGHFDHIYGVGEIALRYGIPVYMHPEDAPILGINPRLVSTFGMKVPDASFPYEPLSDGMTLNILKHPFTVIHTPGHTPGGVCFHDASSQVLISGDTLFAGSIGRSDLPLGDYDKLIVSVMDRLMGLPADTEVLPGHGPTSNIGHERTHNPFLQPFNEKWDDGEGVEGLIVGPDDII